MTAKSVWIELDSVHSRTLKRAMDDGVMPNLARIGQDGGMRRIRYEIPFQGAAWATAHTGRSAADHGAFAFDRMVPGTYRLQIEINPIPSGSTYWEALGKKGKRTLVLNSVNPILTPGLNGIQIAYWATHVAGRIATPTVFPPEMAAAIPIRSRVPAFNSSDWGSARTVNSERLAKAASTNIAYKAEVFCSLIDREAWDHVHIGFDDIHSMSHVLWDRGSDNAGAGRSLFDGSLSDLDTAIGSILDHAGPSAATLIVAIGGIGQQNSWSHMVDKIIARFEGSEASARNLYGHLGRFWRVQPAWLRFGLSSLKTRLRETYLASKRRHSRAFGFPLNEESGGIRINLRGREPAGTVSPGDEFWTLCTELRDALLELRDISSGARLVSQVHFTRDLVANGTAVNMLPDLMIEWNWARRMDAVESERLGRIEVDFWPDRTGDHHVDGVLVTNQKIAASRHGHGDISVIDLAPTIAALHGVESPGDWRGSTIVVCPDAGASRQEIRGDRVS